MVFSTATRRLGIFSGGAFVALSVVYAAVTIIGLVTLPNQDTPIADPWFTAMEVLILLLIPALILLVAAVHDAAPVAVRGVTLAGVSLATMLCVLTGTVHFSVLVLSRNAVFASQPMAPLLVSFHWPSLAYVLDILAWDIAFPLLALALAPAFGGNRLARAVRALLVVSALLAFGGLAGVPGGNMLLRNIGIVGYAAVFPVAVALMVVWFRRGTD